MTKTPGLTRALQHDNPLPPPSGRMCAPPVHDRVLLRARLDDTLVAAVLERAGFGYAKYGRFLYPNDGRGPADMWQEVLDLLQYIERSVAEGEKEEVAAVLTALTNIVEVYSEPC